MEIKRVVTAVNGEAKSVVQEDAPLPPATAGLFPGTDIYLLWGTEGKIDMPAHTPARSATAPFFPGPGGTRFGVFTFPPQTRDAPAPQAPPAEVLESLVAEAEQTFPGLVAAFEPESPGMHTTPTIDYDIVLQGTLTLELDDGAEVELPPGSCIVQNGTRHAWHNYGSETALLAYVIVDARP
ncbi:MAG TPA: cupin domain-containing protein [Solirubrobacteraceae bacterium]|nr:cupin domain-containing protein [Solirubrobacteraceae bacterium]